jgi:hypothetical protein
LEKPSVPDLEQKVFFIVGEIPADVSGLSGGYAEYDGTDGA